MKNFYEKNKSWLKAVLLILLSTTIIYIVVKKVFSPNDDSLKEYKLQENTILQHKNDSLSKELQIRDINIKANEKIVENLELSLQKINIRETVIKEIHYEKIKVVDKYTTNDISVYFDNRFGPDSTGDLSK